MKMYKHVYLPDENRVQTTEFEVEEKESLYVVLPNMNCIWESRVMKDDVGELRGYDNHMFSLSADTSEYICILIELEREKIKSLEYSMKHHGEIIKNLRDLSPKGEN